MGVLIPLCGGLHFHDLRHVGGTLAATTGASLRELMARLGHSSTRAALIDQHATRDRDKAIALALGDLVREVRTVQPDQAPEAANCSMIDSPCGTCVARSEVTNQPDLGRGGPAKALTWDFGLERAKGIEPS